MVIFRSQFSSFKPEIFYNYWKNALFFSVAEISPEKERSLVQDPWKIIVAEELPQKFTPKFVDTLQNQNGNDSQETTTRKKECLSDELRGPKIVKVTYTYKTMKSVRSSIHTFGLETKYSNKKYISFLLDISLLNWTRWWFSVVSMRSNETYPNTQIVMEFSKYVKKRWKTTEFPYKGVYVCNLACKTGFSYISVFEQVIFGEYVYWNHFLLTVGNQFINYKFVFIAVGCLFLHQKSYWYFDVYWARAIHNLLKILFLLKLNSYLQYRIWEYKSI